jgi:serine/threonine protein kinase
MKQGLERYAIMEPLGKGAQASTYRGIDRETGESVAIKVLSLGKQVDWHNFDRFEREIAILRALDHPGIPRFRASFASEASGDYFLVMDLIEGRSLASLLREPAAFDEARLRGILVGLLDILAYLHGRMPAVIHRDINPANVLLAGSDLRAKREQRAEAPGERVVLVDFGVVRLASAERGTTRVGTSVGTFGYMAPEQLHGEASERSDLYGVGATLVACATGVEADALPHAGLAIDFDAIRVPAGLRGVLEALLRPDPRERPASVAHARMLLDGLPLPGSAPPHAGGYAPPPGYAPPHADAPPQSPAQPPAIPELIDELARTPKPFALLVWVVALFGVAGLALVEFGVLPIIDAILRATNKRSAVGQGQNDSSLALVGEFRESIAGSRHMVEHVLRGTSPLRERPALPPPRE